MLRRMKRAYASMLHCFKTKHSAKLFKTLDEVVRLRGCFPGKTLIRGEAAALR